VKPSIIENLQSVCQILNESGVEYLTIGGAAVALHGHVRFTKDSSGQDTNVDDLDFWYNPTYDNYFKLLNALEKLGLDVGEFREEKAPDPKRSYFRLERSKFTLDFLPEVPGMPRFRKVSPTKETAKIDDVEIPYISYEYLIQNKQALNRPKDQEDIRQLELKKQAQKPRQHRPRQRPG
jgi:hypothetical protein